MIDDATTAQLKSLIENAQTILIIYPPAASHDQKAVAASLFLSLMRFQKNVRLVTPQPLKSGEEQPTGIENTQTDIGNQNLSISFNYTPEQVDKVSYHIGEGTGKFYLTIKPKAGYPPLDANNVEFSYTGASADLVILVGVNELESLDQLYFGYEDLYRDVTIISINNYATSFGTVKLDTGDASTTSEVMAKLIPTLGLPLDSDTATNLLHGIESGTQNLSALTVSADTFETVAQLLRAGARRSFKRNGQEPKATPSTEESSLREAMAKGFSERENILEEKPKQERKNGKSQNPKQNQQKKDKLNPPEEFTPVRRI
jgi:hypothetical protein